MIALEARRTRQRSASALTAIAEDTKAEAESGAAVKGDAGANLTDPPYYDSEGREIEVE